MQQMMQVSVKLHMSREQVATLLDWMHMTPKGVSKAEIQRTRPSMKDACLSVTSDSSAKITMPTMQFAGLNPVELPSSRPFESTSNAMQVMQYLGVVHQLLQEVLVLQPGSSL